MRRIMMVLALVAASCSPVAAPESAQAQQTVSVESCITAATTIEARRACKGVVADPCMREPGGDSTAGVVQCQSQEDEQWRALLVARLAGLTADDPTRSEALSTAQTAWLAYREAECAYQAAAYEGGSLARVVGASCYMDLTAERVISLISSQGEVQ
jgi:uncharacterized protein YecT (DUF1311 family)